MMEDINTSMSRREYRRLMEKKRRRLRKRRKARVRRIRFWRTIRTARFWGRVSFGAVVLIGIIFWSKFAFVYNIPAYAQKGALENVQAYITVKTWWFGPPVFNLEQYVSQDTLNLQSLDDPYSYLLLQLGRYDSVVLQPSMIWVERN